MGTEEQSGLKILVKHVGNMGDFVFFIPPVLETLKKKYPDSHITLVTAWGFKDKKGRWGKRNQSGFCIHLAMTDPHIDQLIHYHDTLTDLESTTCKEDGRSFPTWSQKYYEDQKQQFDEVYELDFGIKPDDNPIQRMYQALNMPNEIFSNYKIYLTDEDKAIANATIKDADHPRIVLLESLAGETTRSWDPQKAKELEQAIKHKYGVPPIWFGGRYTPDYQGKPLTLRQNIAQLTYFDVGIGVLSGPLHFAAAVGLPTLTLYADQPIERGAPAYFLNSYISDPLKHHRTLLGPSDTPMQSLKPTKPTSLTPNELRKQHFHDWNRPGNQSTKSGLAAITVDEVMSVLQEMI